MQAGGAEEERGQWGSLGAGTAFKAGQVGEWIRETCAGEGRLSIPGREHSQGSVCEAH